MQDYNKLVHSLEDILSDIQSETIYLKDVAKIDDNNFMITCPCHKGGQESKPSCGVSVKEGLVNCFTCGWKGNLITLTNKTRDIENGFEYLVDRYLKNIEVDEILPIKISFNYLEQEEMQLPSYDSVFNYEEGLNYLKSRKLSEDVIRRFKIGYDTVRGMIQIPLYKGKKLVGWKGRSIKSKKFHNTKNMEKPLFALEHVKGDGYVFLCEAEMDCMTYYTWGLEAIALLGSKMTPQQLEQLKRSHIKHLVIALDNDKVGQESIKPLYDMLKDLEINLYLLLYKDTTNKDANDFNSLEEFKQHVSIRKFKSTL